MLTPPPGPLPSEGRGSVSFLEAEPAFDTGSVTGGALLPLPSEGRGPGGGVDDPSFINKVGIVRGTPRQAKQERALQFRREQTPTEKLLWEKLRANRLDDLHFRRQQVIDGFIADFYCHRAGLVVEVDGAVHESQTGYDEARDAVLRQRGLTVLRIPAERLMSSIPQVLEEIRVAARNGIMRFEDLQERR